MQPKERTTFIYIRKEELAQALQKVRVLERHEVIELPGFWRPPCLQGAEPSTNSASKDRIHGSQPKGDSLSLC